MQSLTDTAANPDLHSSIRRDATGMAALIASAIFVCAISWFQLGSIDLGYHLAYGRHFLDTGKIVEVDPFIYPEVARPFVNANWGSQVLIALAERMAGAAGLIALRSLLLLVIFGCIARIVRLETTGPHWIAWAWMLAAIAGYERFTLRPELFSYALMMVQLLILSKGLRGRLDWIKLGLLQMLWVNLHSYFLVGLILSGAYLCGPMFRVLWNKNNKDHQNDRSAFRLLAVAMGIQMAACLMNPWLHRGALFPIQTLSYLKSESVMAGGEGWTGESAWSAISEFKSPFAFLDQPINIRTIHAYLTLLAVAGLAVAALMAQRQAGPALAVLLLFVMSTQMRRNICQFALVASPLAMLAFSRFKPWSNEAMIAARRVRFIAVLVTIGAAAWWTFGIVEGRFYYRERRINRIFGAGYNNRVFAINAAQWIADHADQLKPNLYVNYFASSNTLPWLPPKFKVFVDTNTFAYREASLSDAYKLGMGQLDHAAFFSDHDVNIVLLHCGSDTQLLVRRLVDDYTNWALVHFDRHAVIFVRRIMDHVPIIRMSPVDMSDLDPAQWIIDTAGSPSQRALDLGIAAGVPLSLGWHSRALALAEEAARLAPDYHEAWQFQGVCHGNLGNDAARAGRLEDAERAYNRALECFGEALMLAPEETADYDQAMAYSRLTIEKLKELAGMKNPQDPPQIPS